jgi:hypothetical protein
MVIWVAFEEVDLTVVLLLPLIIFKAAQSMLASSYHAPYTMPKCEVKEEDDIQAQQHGLRSNSCIMIREQKVEVKEEDDKVAVLLNRKRLNTTSDDPSDTSGFNTAFMASLNDHTAWVGNIDDVIALSIRESGIPLVDLMHDDNEADPSGTVKEDPVDERIDPHEHVYQHSRCIKRRNHR